MKKKIIGMLMTFIMAVALIANVSNAQNVPELAGAANTNLNYFLNMPISTIISGHEGGGGDDNYRAWYCLNEDTRGGNGYRMNTAVVDLGKNGINSIEGVSSSYGNISTTTADGNAQYAAQVIYLAARSYMNGERWRRNSKCTL